jgi:hypothetical protein
MVDIDLVGITYNQFVLQNLEIDLQDKMYNKRPLQSNIHPDYTSLDMKLSTHLNFRHILHEITI